MTYLLEKIINDLPISLSDPEQRRIITGVTWEYYDHLLTSLGEQSFYRVTYLEDVLEIVAPSRNHELIKKNIGRLLEVFFEETETPFWGLGSMTLRVQKKKAGKEPDECYCIGTEKEFPDLAIEVVISSGGLNTLTVYERLGIKEVWFWQNNQFSVYFLSDNKYTQVSKSQLLPTLDFSLLTEYVTQSNPLSTMRSFRAKIRDSFP